MVTVTVKVLVMEYYGTAVCMSCLASPGCCHMHVTYLTPAASGCRLCNGGWWTPT